MRKESIVSIGILDCADGSKFLTPVFKGNTFPKMVKISKIEFHNVKENMEKMIDLAISKLTK